MDEPAKAARLFVAVDLDDAARRAAGQTARDVAQRLVAAGSSDRVSWVRPRNLHLTLRFLGELNPDSVTGVRQLLGRAFAGAAFDVQLGGVGTFPASGSPRVIWLAIRDPESGLTALVAEVDDRLRAAGLTVDRRPFAAHLTVGRVRQTAGRGRAIREGLDRLPVEPVRWRVEHVTLYESHVSSVGPTYVPIVCAPLSVSSDAPMHAREASD